MTHNIGNVVQIFKLVLMSMSNYARGNEETTKVKVTSTARFDDDGATSGFGDDGAT